MTNEQIRLEEARERKAPLEEVGPYLCERLWGTVYADVKFSRGFPS